MIEVQNLVKKYGDFTALHGISFKAREGEILGFLGPNGAGKTTTMRILTGFMPPTSGVAKVAGHDIFEESLAAREKIGYLPETVPLYPDMTVQGYLEFMAELRHVPERKKRTQEVLALVGMEHRAKSLIRSISKGMRQRVGLAQSLIHNPPVLILDEPTIGLDPAQVADLRSFIRDLRTQHTVMFSTHILSEAEQICDRVVIINRGQIVAQGAPRELRSKLNLGSRIYVEARGRADQKSLANTLSKIQGVKFAEPYQNGVVVNVKDNKDVRPALAAAILENGLELLELRPVAITLEEIFLEVTTALGAEEDA
ncbi:MAG: ABC transporter ATP-binding protein [Chloroflexi bacterium]|nr:ABC transporter ATP-binding protein [Chloroflexota bacterium]